MKKKQREHRRPRTTRRETILLSALMAVCISLQFFVRSADPPVAAFFLILIFEAFQSVTPRLAARPRRRASERVDASEPRDARSSRLRLPSLFILLFDRPLDFPRVAGTHASHLCVTFILDQWISALIRRPAPERLRLPFPLSVPFSGAEENVEPISNPAARVPARRSSTNVQLTGGKPRARVSRVRARYYPP